MNILNNLQRQFPMFIDADYVGKYIQGTKAAAIADLMLYRKSLKAANVDIATLDQYMLKVQSTEEELEDTDLVYKS